MEKLFNEIVGWQDITFPEGNAISMAVHLYEEVGELTQTVRYEDLLGKVQTTDDELADCLILLFGIAHKRGMSFQDVEKIIIAKMEINKTRKWKKPNAYGVVHHLKEQ